MFVAFKKKYVKTLETEKFHVTLGYIELYLQKYTSDIIIKKNQGVKETFKKFSVG